MRFSIFTLETILFAIQCQIMLSSMQTEHQFLVSSLSFNLNKIMILEHKHSLFCINIRFLVNGVWGQITVGLSHPGPHPVLYVHAFEWQIHCLWSKVYIVSVNALYLAFFLTMTCALFHYVSNADNYSQYVQYVHMHVDPFVLYRRSKKWHSKIR